VRFATALTLRTQGAPLADPSPSAWQKWGADRLVAGVNVDALDIYLETWRDRFWLIHDKYPFLQDPAIATECTERASTNKLLFDVASGNNPLWWTKTPDKDAPALSFPEAAMALLGQWGYSAGGKCTSRKQDRTSVSNSKQSPLRMFSQFIPRGNSLFETLLMCCTPANGDDGFALKDTPVWEKTPADKLVPGQLGRLTASMHAFLLSPGEGGVIKIVNTWATQKYSENFWDADVFMARKKETKGTSPFKFRPSDAVWHHAPSILAKDSAEIIPPVVVDLARNPLGHTDVFDRSGITVVTHFADKSKDLGWSRSELPEILKANEDRDARMFTQLRQFCEITSGIKNVLTKTHTAQEKLKPIRTMLEQWFWIDAERGFYQVLGGEQWNEVAIELIDSCKKRFNQASEQVNAPSLLVSLLQFNQDFLRKLNKLVKDWNLTTSSQEVT